MKKLKAMSRKELLELARARELTGYSSLNKLERSTTRKNVSSSKSEAVLPQRTRSRTVPRKSSSPKTATLPLATTAVDLPAAYRDGRFVLLTRDPFWLYCYWDLTPPQEKKLWAGENPTLRLVEIVNHEQERELKRFVLSRGARSWYLQVDTSHKSFRAELGHVDNRGQFESVAKSNVTDTPRETVSPNVETQFATVPPPPPAAGTAPPAITRGSMAPGDPTVGERSSRSETSSGKPSSRAASSRPASTQERRLRPYPAPALQPVSPATAERFYQYSGGVPSKQVRSSNSAEAVWEQQERLGPQLFSEVLLSATIGEKFLPGSLSPERVTALGKDYWLVVDTDLIVYGATIPGSRVSILETPVTVDAEGHFSARFTLPNGLRDIPIEGSSPDQKILKGARIRVERATSQW